MAEPPVSSEVLDYFGPALSVLIKRSGRGGVSQADLEVMEYLGEPDKNGLYNLNSLIQSCQLTEAMGSFALLKVDLAAPFDVAQKLVETFLVTTGNILVVQFGYTGTNNLIRSSAFIVMSWPEVSFGMQTTISLRGVPLGNMMSIYTRCDSWLTSKVTRRTVLQQLASDHEMILEIDSLSEADLKKMLDDTRTQDTPQGGRTDFDFFRSILEEMGATFRVRDDKLQIFSKNGLIRSQTESVGTFVVYGRVDSKKREWPCSNFTIQGTDWFMRSATVGTERRLGIDPLSGQNANQELEYLTDSEVVFLGIGARAIGQKYFGQQAKTAVPGEDDQKTQIRPWFAPELIKVSGDILFEGAGHNRPGIVQNRRFDASFAGGMRATLTTPGNPMLHGGDTVVVKGAGAPFDKPYVISQLQHTIGSNGFETSLELLSNTIQPGPAKASGGEPLDSQGDIPAEVGNPRLAEGGGKTVSATKIADAPSS